MFSNKKNEKGQGLVEYAIILALVAIVVIGVMRILGPKIGCTFSGINASLPGGSGSSSSNCSASSGGGAYANWQSIPRMGSAYATEYFCNTAGSGHAYNAWTVGSGWDITAGTDVPQSSINSGNATLLSSGTCP
jgi:pilus assembly protein Flp/PilA